MVIRASLMIFAENGVREEAGLLRGGWDTSNGVALSYSMFAGGHQRLTCLWLHLAASDAGGCFLTGMGHSATTLFLAALCHLVGNRLFTLHPNTHTLGEGGSACFHLMGERPTG